MQSQANPWDEGVPRGMSVEAFTPDVPGAHAGPGMPASAWAQQIGADGAIPAAGGEPPASALDVPPSTGDGAAPESSWRATDGLISRASNEQLLQAAVRATREAAQAAAELRRSLEQHKRRTAS